MLPTRIDHMRDIHNKALHKLLTNLVYYGTDIIEQIYTTELNITNIMKVTPQTVQINSLSSIESILFDLHIFTSMLICNNPIFYNACIQMNHALDNNTTTMDITTEDDCINTKVVTLQHIALQLFTQKNQDYGDSFATYGLIGVLVRIGDKMKRLHNILNKHALLVVHESATDTIIDLYNYSAMAIIMLVIKYVIFFVVFLVVNV